MSELAHSPNKIDSILESLLQVPELDDPDARDGLVEELKAALHRQFEIPRFADRRLDLASLLNCCLACSGGLRTLTALVGRRSENETGSRIAALTDELIGTDLLSAPDRESLRAILAATPIVQIADAVGELVDAGELRTLQSWRDIPTAIRVMERLPVTEDGVPQLLIFADRLSHLVNQPESGRIRQWIDTVAGGLGVATAQLRRWRGNGDGTTIAAQRSSPEISAQRQAAAVAGQPPRAGVIWGGGVPIRNRNFTGRAALLDRLGEALRHNLKASVLPQTLHGMGGVGKTQLVVEYVYRHLEDYDLVWWIPAEHASSVLSSLFQLAERLGLATTTEDQQQTARTVLDALAGSELSWLLIYDNADELSSFDQFIPSAGGHVILTSRNQEWATVGLAIEVDVFEREESIQLLQKRTRDEETGAIRISVDEADKLADKLGDLPLALEQAAAWYLATAMPVHEYLELLDTQVQELLSEGKPANYPLTVAAFVNVAVQQLREQEPATAQLFELFAYLGGQPVAMSLLREGKDADIPQRLRHMLGSAIPVNRAVRTLSRYGLAKVDPAQRVQVHRLVQRVLRDSLPPDLARQTLSNVQLLLAAASPGDPDEQGELHRLRELGPHIEPAELVRAENLAARQVVVDHMRYLYITGDYENSLRLARRAVAVWEHDTSSRRLGPDGDLTLIARAHTANAMRTLGDSQAAADLARDTYMRMQRSPDMGQRHELTLIVGNQIGHDLRIQGRYREALEFDRESVALHRQVFDPVDAYTLRAQSNLAVDQRMVGDFAEAFRLDREIAAHWEDVGGNDHRALSAYINMARSHYGMGAYQAGLDVLERCRFALLDLVGPRHSQVLLAGRTHAILLRKAGRIGEAAEIIRENLEQVHNRFGAAHEFSVAVSVSYANTLRELGELDEAAQQISGAIRLYEDNFGESHPLTLIARINEAIILRAQGEVVRAHTLDAHCYEGLTQLLGPGHPYTLCAGTSLATDHALAGDHQSALELSTRMLDLSRDATGGGHDARQGAEHPYLLMRAVNLAHDLRANGRRPEADDLLAGSLEGLRRALGRNHPQVIAIDNGQRAEGDVEAPPT